MGQGRSNCSWICGTRNNNSIPLSVCRCFLFPPRDNYESYQRVESRVQNSDYREHDETAPPNYFAIYTSGEEKLRRTNDQGKSYYRELEAIHRLGVIVRRRRQIACARDCQPKQSKTDDGFPGFAHNNNSTVFSL
jgi:hypothetical protein